MNSNNNTNTIAQAVQITLERLGVTSGFITYSKAAKVYGKWFVELAKRGEIRPIHKGDGKNGAWAEQVIEANGAYHYLVSDILEKIDAAKLAAYTDLIINN